MTVDISDLAKSLSKQIENKDSNKLIRRAGTFEPGTYAVVIAAVDTSELDKGRVTLTFESQHKEQHKQTIWMTNFNGDGLSDGLEALLFGLFGDDNQYLGIWLQFLSKPEHKDHAFQLMRGMKLTITLGDTEGFIITNHGGKYTAINNKTGFKYCGPFPRRIQAKRTALANGLKEPKSVLLDAEPTHDDDNQQALYNSVKAITDTEAGGDSEPVRLETVK